MVTRAQQGGKQRRQRGHPGRKREACDTIFHFVNFLFKSIGCRRALTSVGIAGLTLKHRGQFTRVSKSVLG